MSSPRFCITARNRLTGEREVVTPPLSLQTARDVKLKYGYRNHTKSAYTNPKIEVYPPPRNLSLSFEQQEQ